jgi:hypothetical protein
MPIVAAIADDERESRLARAKQGIGRPEQQLHTARRLQQKPVEHGVAEGIGHPLQSLETH